MTRRKKSESLTRCRSNRANEQRTARPSRFAASAALARAVRKALRRYLSEHRKGEVTFAVTVLAGDDGEAAETRCMVEVAGTSR
jgi:hypothetical protein